LRRENASRKFSIARWTRSIDAMKAATSSYELRFLDRFELPDPLPPVEDFVLALRLRKRTHRGRTLSAEHIGSPRVLGAAVLEVRPLGQESVSGRAAAARERVAVEDENDAHLLPAEMWVGVGADVVPARAGVGRAADVGEDCRLQLALEVCHIGRAQAAAAAARNEHRDRDENE
jgi:hypothetical protein